MLFRSSVRALAVTSAQRSQLAPELPPLRETLPGYEFNAMWGLFAPAHLPATLLERLNRETVRVLAQAENKDRLIKAGVEAAGSGPQDFSAALKSDMDRLGKLIKEHGIKAD